MLQRKPSARPFLFATGLECSYPTITGPDGGRLRRDEYEATGHYEHWKEDFALVKEMGISVLRYGPPYYKVHRGAGRYDWDFVDETFRELKRLKISPIADLCHFGVPDWIGSFQNPEWPAYFADYARAFANRYPWVGMFTPVNEIYVAATFSAEHGAWNEQLKSDHAFITALKHLTKATVLAEEAILDVNPEAAFVQSEATTYYHAEDPGSLERTHFLNERRFLSLDLCYGVEVSSLMYQFLRDNGMKREEYQWYMTHAKDVVPACIMGNDYYAMNEHMVPPGEAPFHPAGNVFGYYILTHQYYDRYRIPVMHTETNQLGSSVPAEIWLRNMWLNMLKLKEDGVPLVGFTWYSLIDQVDWDSGLQQKNGHENPVGLFDLRRKERVVGGRYRELIQKWRPMLARESRRLDTHMLDEAPEGAAHV
ncbi:MAG TPA: family 1 glycosylhydrolase [Phycisphaerae bacterium]|nr:family 1 glycosylhydrolase [Phycisphaerae bacterium]